VTVSTCTGTTARAIEIEARTGGICENMEGAAVALACRQLSVPLLEIRGISNLVEDRDSRRWDLANAMAAAQEAVIILLEKWPEQ
jgi:futalosine hydrolase